MKAEIIVVQSSTPPIVEIDWDAQSAYIRFSSAKVAKTVERPCDHCFIAIDLDRHGKVIGVEAVGEAQIEIAAILKRASVRAPNVDFSRVRYMRPNHIEEEDKNGVPA